MQSEKKYFVLTAILVSSLLICFTSWYYTHVYLETYLFFDGDYYSFSGGGVNSEAVGKELGKVKRCSLRTFWNRSGDSNHIPLGSKIYMRAGPESGDGLLVGILYMNMSDGQIKERYHILRKEK